MRSQRPWLLHQSVPPPQMTQKAHHGPLALAPSAFGKDSATSFWVSPAPAKNVNEACVINEECSFRNPNVLCINSSCKCSHPYELTAANVCVLPSSHGGDMFTIALSVALALVPLLLGALYAYQKDTSLPDVDNEELYLVRDNDGGEAHQLRPQSRGPHGGSCVRDSSVPPRHPSCFINQRAAKCPKIEDSSTVRDVDSSSHESGDDELELPLNDILVAKAGDDPRATPPRRTFKETRLHSQARRKTGAELGHNDQDEFSSAAMHTLGFKNEQMLNVIDKHRLVVTVEVHEPRQVCKAILGEARNPAPIVPLWRRELPQSESTDDPFMKELKRRHGLNTRSSDRLVSRTSRSLSAEVLHVEGAAFHSDAVEVTPEEAAPQKAPMVVQGTTRDKEPANTGMATAASVPVQEFSASTEAAKDQIPDIEYEEKAPSKAIEKSGAADEISQPRLEHGAPKSPRHLQLPDQEDQCIVGGEKRTAVVRSYTPKRRRASWPPVLRSCGTEDRTVSDKASRLPETRDNDVTKPIRVEVAVSRAAAAFDEKGNDLQMQEAKQDTAVMGTNKSGRPPTLVFDKDTNTGATSARVGSAEIPRQNGTPEDQLVNDGAAGKVQRAHTCHTGIKEVGELVRLLSRLIRTHEQAECSTSSAEDSAAMPAQRPLRCKRHKEEHSDPTHHRMKTGSTTGIHAEEEFGESAQHVSDTIVGAIREKSLAGTPVSPVQTNVSVAKVSQEEITRNREPLVAGEVVRKATEPLKSELLEAYGKKPNIRKPKTPAESDKPRGERRTEGTIGKLKLREETTPPEQSSLQTTTSADDAKYGSDRIGGRLPEAVPLGMPQDYRGWVPIGAAYAAQRPTDGGASFGLAEIVGNTGGTRGTSLTSSDIGDIRSASLDKSPLPSTPPDSTSSHSGQTPYQEYMAKQLRPAVQFNERPFADVLASMESEPTSTWIHNEINSAPDLGSALEKSSSARQSSGPSSINDENLDKATIKSSSNTTSTDSGTAVVSAEVGVTSTSVADSTCVAQAGKIPVSFKKGKEASADCDDTSRETARALPVFSDSDEASIPLSGSMSLLFVSPTSSSNVTHRVSDLADLPRLQNNVVAANNETGDGSIVLLLPLPRLASSAVQTGSSHQPASSITGFGAQAQELPGRPCRSGLPLLQNTRRSEIGNLMAMDRPLTEDIKKVVVLGNKHYLRQQARRRPMVKSVTTIDETQCLLFKLADQSQPDATSSSVAPEVIWSTSMSSESTREGCESTQELLPRRNTVSPGRDVGTLASDSSLEQPLKLSDLILLQHPEVGLTSFVAVDFTGAADAHGGEERGGILLEAKTEREPGLRLNTHRKVSAVGTISELTCISNSSPKAANSQRRLELEGSGWKKATAETAVARVTEPDVDAAAPQPSQHVASLPNCAVAIRLPGGKIRTVHPGQQAFSCASPQGTAAIRPEQRSPQVLTATVLDQATFESVYNAILQPPPDVTAAEEPSAPRDANPVRAMLSAQVSFDDPLTTVMPIELASGSSIKPDSAEAMGISGSGAPSPLRKSRPRGSRSRSLSGSCVLAVTKAPGVAATEVASAATTVPGRSGASATNVTGAAGASPDRPGAASGGQETRAQLTSRPSLN
ncbi:hypothetical protein HPB50_022883 [Hyalomma asiaticum]|uniref:Uncharacterized protein n=1 Tax=Hyalomma asiaticum TaxID=266040 RepID=A0ACB7SH46_HYAAI|nr:hypothetical protein HPB50_022883 [Hyalomma asiaticum]